MADPAKVADTYGEYFELYSAGSATVDLKGFTLKDSGTNKHVIASSVTVAPGQYVALGKSTDTTKNGGAPVAYSYAASTWDLANSADEVIVLDDKGRLVDQVAYDKTKGWKVTAGVAISFGYPSAGAQNPRPGRGPPGTRAPPGPRPAATEGGPPARNM